MQAFFSLIFLVCYISLEAQVVSVSPNHTRRYSLLYTTITPYGSSMTISSGIGSQYQFWLQRGGEIINGSINYSFNSSGLGFANSVIETFNIPYTATPGFYDLYVNNPNSWTWNNSVFPNAVEILETNISGKVFFDLNQNGTLDTNENGISNQRVMFIPSNTIITTGLGGSYNAVMDEGTYTDNILIPAGFNVTTPSSISLTVPPDTLGNNFGIYTPPVTGVLLHEFYSSFYPIRCNRPSKAIWSVTSYSNNIEKGSITLKINGGLNYLNSTFTPDFVSNDSIRWTYILAPFQTLTNSIQIQGTLLNSNANCIFTDCLTDSTDVFYALYCDTINENILCSHDPNDITAFPGGTDSVFHYTDRNSSMTYRIRFQNCGTDTAFDVSILNWIDPDLNLNSFRLIFSSNPVSIQFENNRTLRFIFKNIMLPDSNIDELNSHAMLVYTINPNSNLANNTLVTNNAYIYFDHNPAVVTNLAYNTFIDSSFYTGVENFDFEKVIIYPNPVCGNSVLVLPNDFPYKLTVYDFSGNQILDVPVREKYIIQSEFLSSGLYLYKLVNKTNSTIYSGKFVVMH